MLFWDKNYFELKILEKQIPLGTCCSRGGSLCTRNNPKLPGPGLFQDELVTYFSPMGYEWFPGWPDPTSSVMTELWEKAAAIPPPWEMGRHTDGGRVIPHIHRKWGLSPWAKADPQTCLDF